MGRPEDLDLVGEEAFECQNSFQGWLIAVVLKIESGLISAFLHSTYTIRGLLGCTDL